MKIIRVITNYSFFLFILSAHFFAVSAPQVTGRTELKDGMAYKEIYTKQEPGGPLLECTRVLSGPYKGQVRCSHKGRFGIKKKLANNVDAKLNQLRREFFTQPRR